MFSEAEHSDSPPNSAQSLDSLEENRLRSRVSLSGASVPTTACFLPTPHPACRHGSGEAQDIRRPYQVPLGSRRGLSSDKKTFNSFIFFPNGTLVLSRHASLPHMIRGQILTLLSLKKWQQPHPLARGGPGGSMYPDFGQGDIRECPPCVRERLLLPSQDRETERLIPVSQMRLSLDRAPGTSTAINRKDQEENRAKNIL